MCKLNQTFFFIDKLHRRAKNQNIRFVKKRTLTDFFVFVYKNISEIQCITV